MKNDFNNEKVKANTVIFDYDGTLYDSKKVYVKSFREIYDILIKDGNSPTKQYTDEEIVKWLGVTPKDMWAEFMPQLSEKNRNKYSETLGKIIAENTSKGNGELYQGTEDTLRYLKSKGKKIILLSNCTNKYMTTHKNKFSLDRYFDLMCCSEDFNYMTKAEIFSQYIEVPTECYVIVGDRDKDIEIAQNKDNIFTVGCSYGFGSREELVNSDIIIDDISELCNIL